MIRDRRKKALRKIAAAIIFTLCVSVFPRALPVAMADGDPVWFDLLEGAVFDDDSGGRLTYDTTQKKGVVKAANTKWVNRNFSCVQYENVMTPDGEKPFNECTAEFSVTYSDIHIGALEDTVQTLGIQMTSGKYSLAYRVQGELKYGYSSLLVLGTDDESPFVSGSQRGNYRIGKDTLSSSATMSVKVTPKKGEENGQIVFTLNGEEIGSLVYESEEHIVFGLVVANVTAKISDASYKVYGATGWVLPPPPPSYSVFDGNQVNNPFGYSAKTNSAEFTATGAETNKPFGNIPEYRSVTLTDGTKTTAGDVVWEYEATFTAFNYVNGKDKDVPENYYGTGLMLMTSDGVTLNMRIMYDGRLNVASSSPNLFGLGQYGKNYNIYNFAPSVNADDVNKTIGLKYVVDRKNGKISYFINGIQYGTVEYIGKAELDQFGLHSYYGGGKYSDFSLRMMYVSEAELPPRYEVFDGGQKNDVFSYDGQSNTASIIADKRNYTKAFAGIPVYKSLTLSDGRKIRPSEAAWEYSATVTDLTFGNEPLNYYGIGISLMTESGVSLDMRVMYDGRLYVCAVPASGAADFGLSASGKITNIPDFDPKNNPDDAEKELRLKFRVDRASGKIGYYVDGSLYGSVVYSGKSRLTRYALHSWWGGGKYKDFSLTVSDVTDVEIRDYFGEEYVSENPYDKPAAKPNLDEEQSDRESGKGTSCSGGISAESTLGTLIIAAAAAISITRKKKGED